MLISASYIIRGEGLESRGLEFTLGNHLYPVIGSYGILTFGFIYNVNEEWAPITLIIGTGWTASFQPVPSTTWTVSF